MNKVYILQYVVTSSLFRLISLKKFCIGILVVKHYIKHHIKILEVVLWLKI